MASGDSERFPLPITFDDDAPKDGYATLHLTIEEMEVKNPAIGSARAKNAEIEVQFSNGVVSADVVVTKNGQKVHYVYKKNLPADVKEKDCNWKVRSKGASQIIIVLAKAKKESWAAHAKHFMQPPGS